VNSRKKANMEVQPRLRFMRRFKYDPYLLQDVAEVSGKNKKTILNNAYLLLEMLANG